MAHCDLSYMWLFVSSRFANSGWCSLVIFMHSKLAIAYRDSNRSQMPFSVCSLFFRHSHSGCHYELQQIRCLKTSLLSCSTCEGQLSKPSAETQISSTELDTRIWDCARKLIHCSACDALIDHDLQKSIHPNRSPSRKFNFSSIKKIFPFETNVFSIWHKILR